MLTRDKLWKGIFEDFFPEAIAFFFPDFTNLMDWSRGFEMLDKEQKQIFPESEESHRRVDILTKVWLLDGSEQWILIHIEVQGYWDDQFAKRMFTYFYRLTDRYKVPVSALALLTDGNKNWKPDHYRVQYMNTRLLYEYPIFKLSDFSDQDFANSANPWAWVMKTALNGLNSTWDDDVLLKIKVQLYKEFRANGYTVDKTRTFLQFLKYYIRFDKSDFFSKFDSEIQTVDQNKDTPMGIIELVKQHIVEEARLEGLEKGMEQGLEQGLEKGLEQGLQQGLTKGELLKARKVAMHILKKHPEWSDEEIAEVVEMPVSFILQVRQELLQGN
ncbi:MAG: hypothetical protein ACKV1O_29415 [Saprospiraceae bacterium]